MGKEQMEQEKQYDILQNSAGDLMVAIKARMEDTNNPKIVYDGGEHAILYRTDDSAILLDYIHPDVRTPFLNAGRVLVIEVRDESIIREYNVPVKKMKKIPTPADIQTKL